MEIEMNKNFDCKRKKYNKIVNNSWNERKVLRLRNTEKLAQKGWLSKKKNESKQNIEHEGM